MTLANMRELGMQSVAVQCEQIGCAHEGSINVDHLPDDVPVPDVALRLHCLSCGSHNVKTAPNWNEGTWAREYRSG